MPDIVIWILIIVGMTIPVLIGALFNYFLNKKKVVAETEKIKLENKITKDITYEKLQKESKHKDIKAKIEILRQIVILEEEIKNKEQITESDQKKLESLEMIKKEFKESFAKEETKSEQEISKIKNNNQNEENVPNINPKKGQKKIKVL